MSLKHSLILLSTVLAVNQTSFAKKITPQKYMAPLIAKKQKLKTLTMPQLKAEIAKLTIHYNGQHSTIQDLVNEIANHQSTVQKNLEEQASLLNNVIAHNQACIDSLQEELNMLNHVNIRNIPRREPPFPGCPTCG